MIVYIVIFISVVALISIFIIKVKDNFAINKLAIDEAEVAIETLLKKKFDLLNSTSEIVAKELDRKEPIVKKIVSLRSKKLSDQDLDKELDKICDELAELAFNKRKLKKIKEFVAFLDKITDVEIQLNATKDFYNNKVTINNNYVDKFPSNIIAKIFGYKTIEYFNLNKETTD